MQHSRVDAKADSYVEKGVWNQDTSNLTRKLIGAGCLPGKDGGENIDPKEERSNLVS